MNKRTAAAVTAGIASIGGVTAVVAQAAVPTFPHNIVVFPDRDFITLQGYQDAPAGSSWIGDTMKVEVTRGATVVGSAIGTITEGDVAFEINHPGGYCW